MSWRTVVVSGYAKLDYKMDYLVVRKKEEVFRIHLSEIYILLLDSTTISITTALLSELTKKKIKVIFCDEKHNPSSELVAYYGCHDTSMKVRQQVEWTKSTKKEIWTEIITEKIRQQMLLLEEEGHKDRAEILKRYSYEVIEGDESNREGHAAKVYFNSLFGLDFTRSSDNHINACLNYGYGILLSCVNKEIVANGYITQLGIFHSSMYNNFNLGSDLMEPFRPIVDREVVRKLKEGFISFEKGDKIDMLNLLDKNVIIDGKNNTLTNSIKIYTRSIFDALNERDISVIRFYKYEL